MSHLRWSGKGPSDLLHGSSVLSRDAGAQPINPPTFLLVVGSAWVALGMSLSLPSRSTRHSSRADIFSWYLASRSGSRTCCTPPDITDKTYGLSIPLDLLGNRSSWCHVNDWMDTGEILFCPEYIGQGYILCGSAMAKPRSMAPGAVEHRIGAGGPTSERPTT